MSSDFQHYSFRMPNIGFQNLPLNIYIVVFGTAIFVFILSLLFCCYLIRLRHQAHKELYAYKQVILKEKVKELNLHERICRTRSPPAGSPADDAPEVPRYKGESKGTPTAEKTACFYRARGGEITQPLPRSDSTWQCQVNEPSLRSTGGTGEGFRSRGKRPQRREPWSGCCCLGISQRPQKAVEKARAPPLPQAELSAGVRSAALTRAASQHVTKAFPDASCSSSEQRVQEEAGAFREVKGFGKISPPAVN
ncbi:RING finger protein 24 isoform X2 [Cygnus atratus]|nr:RING finger protein 24 isoform X2 [Cygnus atratus]XP_050566141.1 RING finger protein 24 isoform X2 [Cygnus atratus]